MKFILARQMEAIVSARLAKLTSSRREPVQKMAAFRAAIYMAFSEKMLSDSLCLPGWGPQQVICFMIRALMMC